MNKLVLSVNKKEGIFKQVPCYLVFSDEGVILNFISRERQQEELAKYKDQLKAEGKGLLKRTLMLANFWKEYADNFYNMTKEEVLALDAQNNFIPYGNISKFKFVGERQDTSTDPDIQTNNTPGKIEIEAGQKLKFQHKYSDNNRNIKPILEGLFGKKLKYKAQRAIVLGGKDRIM